jgi:stage V sporulation protein SpoVS
LTVTVRALKIAVRKHSDQEWITIGSGNKNITVRALKIAVRKHSQRPGMDYDRIR